MANKQINELPASTVAVNVPATNADGQTVKIAAAQLVANEFDALDVPTMVNNAQSAADDAAGFAEDSRQHASSPVDTLLEDGTYSSLHYSEKARSAARSAALLPEKIIDDTVASPYVLQAEDKFRTLVITRSNALSIKLPQNWHNDPAPDGSSSQAWVDFVRLGSGLPTFVNETTTVVLTPTVIARDNFVYTTNTDPPPAYTGTHTLTVPAGNNRKFVAVLFAIHNSNKTGRNSTLTATNTSSLTKIISDTSTGNYAATSVGPIVCSMWSASMADSTTATTVTITVTPDADPWSYVLYAVAVKDVASVTGAVATSGTANSTTAARAITTTTDKSLVLAGLSIRGGDTLPVTLSGPGTQRFNGRSGSKGVKDIGYILLDHLANTAGAFTYTLTSGESDKTATYAVICTPNTGSLVASTLLAPDGATLSAAGKCCTIRARSDGSSYIKEG